MTFEIDKVTTPAVEAGTAMPMLKERDTALPTAPSLVPLPDDGAAEPDLVAEHDFEVEWPSDYSLDQEGLWFHGSGDHNRISGPFKVLGEARNSESTGWGVAVEWRDRDDVPHCAVVSRSDLIGGSDVMRALVEAASNCRPSRVI